MAKKTPHISGAEWEVMRVACLGAPSRPRTSWTPSRQRLEPRRSRPCSTPEDQGALGYEALQGVRVPAGVRMEDCVRQESQSFLDRGLRGATAPLLAHFVKRLKLSRDEIDELKRILAEKAK